LEYYLSIKKSEVHKNLVSVKISKYHINMKTKLLQSLAALSVMLILVSYAFFPENDRKDKLLQGIITESLTQAHFAPQVIDDAFSEKLFNLFIDRVDFSKQYFLQSDIEELSMYKTQLDNQINQGTFEFFEKANQIFNERLLEVDGFYADMLSEPFDFTVDETIELDHDKVSFPTNDNELRERWRKLLKYQVLTRLDEALTQQEKNIAEKKDSLEIKTLEVLEKEAREKVLKNMTDILRRYKQIDRDDNFNLYLNCIANIYDPHTEYYPPSDKENFDISMSGQLEGIGATLQEFEGYTKVAQIVIGSPSWKQGELEAGDLILKVAQENQEPVDIVGMRLDEAVHLIRGAKGTKVTLNVKKIDGTIKNITITRDVVVIEETYAKSILLKDESEKLNVGFISLPKFYADFQNANGRRCAADVEEEIKRLQKENIDGLILDLRNNGGGSLQDAIKMMGLFIEKGPVVQVKGRYNFDVLKDQNQNVLYAGPLIVLVNQFSASASEILAAAVQDYGRGVIIGSESTFGKGTVQQFYELDQIAPSAYNDVKPLGALKVTIQKFYRINGGATQLNGVVPDIILPDIYRYLEVGEREQEFPLKWDEVEKATFTVFNTLNNINKIKRNSSSRVRENEVFTLLEENAKRMERQSNSTLFSLNLEKFRAEQKRANEEAKKYENLMKDATGVKLFPYQEDLLAFQTDTVSKARAEEWHKQLRNDIYLEEAIEVLKDMRN